MLYYFAVDKRSSHSLFTLNLLLTLCACFKYSYYFHFIDKNIDANEQQTLQENPGL